ncbi:MAG TPA: amidase [Streptosporangiaceae bacterium]|nr:amidase [Streptosporangiaceae bacterium]
MTTWLARVDALGDGPRLAVKDCIDVAGLPTTVGCPVIASDATPAASDAPVVAAARRAGARVLGKTNLSELCWSADGLNRWSGNPRNPLDPRLIPGGSSSGSAVAVAAGEADVGYGTDTGGSIRIPAACCGITGLKTTWGRVSVAGVYPLAPSLDTVGPLGRDVAAVELGMRLIEPGFIAGAYNGPMLAGRLRTAVAVQPAIDAAIDAALAAAGFALEEVRDEDFAPALTAADVLIDAEGYRSNEHLLPRLAELTEQNQRSMEMGATYGAADLEQVRVVRDRLRKSLTGLLERYPVLALPTLAGPPPRIGERAGFSVVAHTAPVNLAGLPALALPVPLASGLPASLQLIGPDGGEERLIAVARIVEEAIASGNPG